MQLHKWFLGKQYKMSFQWVVETVKVRVSVVLRTGKLEFFVFAWKCGCLAVNKMSPPVFCETVGKSRPLFKEPETEGEKKKTQY
jgi:hypothetical protein